MPEDISTTDRVVDSVEDIQVTPEVSGVAAAVATLASAVTEEDPAKLTVHPVEMVVTPLADRAQQDSEDNRHIDIRSSARVETVDTKKVVPGEDMDTAAAMVEG